MIDIDRVREETRAVKSLIHFNNAGASLVPDSVLKATTDYLTLESEIGGYEAFDQCSDALEGIYTTVANFIKAKPDEIALLENATSSWDMAFYSIDFKAGDTVITGEIEYASNFLAFLDMSKKKGIKIEVIPRAEDGPICLKTLRQKIDDRTKLIAVNHVPSHTGSVFPAKEIGKIANEAGVLYLLDACQSVGQIPIDVNDIGASFLSATGRKYLRGPRGTGFLYVKKDVLETLSPPFIDLYSAHWLSRDSFSFRDDARRFENWESSAALRLGLDAAIKYADHLGIEDIWERVRNLAGSVRRKLAGIKKVRVHDVDAIQSGIVSFTVEGNDPRALQLSLRERRINVHTSSHEDSRYDMESRNLETTLRASVHYFNTEDEIDAFCAALERLAA